MHGNTTDTAGDDLALAGVNAGANGDAECGNALDDLAARSHRTSRAVKRDEEAITGRVDLAAAEALDGTTDDGVMLCQEIVPGPVADPGRALRGADDVREQDRANLAHQIALQHPFTLEKPLVQRLRGRPGARPQFLAQESPQLFVGQQCLSNVALPSEHLHQKTVAALPVGRQPDQGSRRALGRWQFGAREAEPDGCDALVRAHQDVVDLATDLVDPWRLVAGQEPSLRNMQCHPGRSPRSGPVTLRNTRGRTMKAFAGRLEVDPSVGGQHEAHVLFPSDRTRPKHASQLGEQRAQSGVGRSGKAVWPQ